MNSKELTFIGNENTLLISDSIHSLTFDTLNAEHLVCPLLQIDNKRQFYLHNVYYPIKPS